MNLIKKIENIFKKKNNYQKYSGRRRDELSKYIAELTNYTVSYGPFKGLKFTGNEIWTKHCLGNMILGLYEKEVTEEIIRSSNDYRIFIDVGAADGYFAVSVMLNDLFEKCFAYDIDQMARKNIRSLSELNKIQERVKIFSTFNRNSLADLDLNEKCLILIDIEGEEYNLLDENTFKNFIKCKIIVELHEFDPQSNDKIAQLIYNSRSTHTFKYLEMGERDLSKIPEIRFLSDNDRWLLCSEGRPYLMRWIVFEPN